MTITCLNRLGAALIGAAIAAAAGPGLAQQGEAPAEMPPPTVAPAPAASFDDATLESYATASAELRTIADGWTERMAASQDAEEVVQMQQDAEAEMVEAVEAEGLTVERYNEITRAAQADPQLAERLTTMIDDAAQAD